MTESFDPARTRRRGLVEVNRTPSIDGLGQDRPIRAHLRRALYVHGVVLPAVPRRDLRPDLDRHLYPEPDLAGGSVRDDALPNGIGGRQRLGADLAQDHGGVLGTLIEVGGQRGLPEQSIAVEDLGFHAVVVDPDILIGISDREIESDDRVFETAFPADAGNRESLYAKPRSVRAQAEPQDKCNDAEDEEEGQKYRAHTFSGAARETLLDSIGVGLPGSTRRRRRRWLMGLGPGVAPVGWGWQPNCVRHEW